MGIYEQPVQHFNVVTLGWLMYVLSDIEIKLWLEFFRKKLKKKRTQRQTYRSLSEEASGRKKSNGKTE